MILAKAVATAFVAAAARSSTYGDRVAIGYRCALAPDALFLGLAWAAEPSEGDLRVVTRVAMQSDPTHDANGDIRGL